MNRVFNGDVTLELRNTRYQPKTYGAQISSIYPINYNEEIIVNIAIRHCKYSKKNIINAIISAIQNQENKKHNGAQYRAKLELLNHINNIKTNCS